ncbi:hypothetical protein, partial [Arsukibacterium sp.]|uniref:hypothetical protein n=1 Tax=Arsukibacterium sp. TaxID=1977258 RepID=UPI002FD889ED
TALSSFVLVIYCLEQLFRQLIEHYAAFESELKPYSIKVYNWLEPEVYRELVSQAKVEGFKISGHKPRKLTL